MTTKAEFDAFIAGFKLAGHEHIGMDQLDAILGKVDEVVAGLTANAAPAPAEEPQTPVAVEPAPAVVPAPEPAPEPTMAVSEQVQESPAPVDPAPAAEVVAGDAPQAVTGELTQP